MEDNNRTMSDEELSYAISDCNKKMAFPGVLMGIGILLFIIGAIIRVFPAVILGFLGFIAGAVFLGKVSREKKKLISDNITRSILKEIFNIKKYNPEEYVSEEVVKKTGLIPRHWDRFSGSDYFEGNYKGVDIVCSDLHIVEEGTSTDADGNTSTTEYTIFKGQWIILRLNKPVRSRLIVREKEEKLFGRGYFKQKSDFETENVEFNKKFRIETNDGHEVFYILTPHFMEQIMKTDDRADAKTAFCFMNDEVHFMCYNDENLFEVSGRATDVASIRQRMKEEAHYITRMIDALLENEYLFGTGNK